MPDRSGGLIIGGLLGPLDWRLVFLVSGIQPSGRHTMGWTNPWVLAARLGGTAMLIVFAMVEKRVADPMFELSLFRIRSFTDGNLASLLSAIGRGGLILIFIIWLQDVWLPQRGYSFAQTPLWAGIYMLPPNRRGVDAGMSTTCQSRPWTSPSTPSSPSWSPVWPAPCRPPCQPG